MALSRVLLAAASGSGDRRFADDLACAVRVHGGARVAAAVQFHGLIGVLAAALGPDRTQLFADVAELQALWLRHVFVQRAVLRDLATVDRVLGADGTPFIVVKGPALAALAYSDPSVRTFVDLDILVPRPAFRRSIDALVAAGFAHSARNWRLLSERTMAELPLFSNDLSALDVHWHLLFGPEDRRRFRLPAEPLFDRARRVVVGDLAVTALASEDALLHLALHAARAGGDRLLWLRDVDGTVVHDGVDWDVVLSRARASGASLVLALMLHRARAALGTPVPRAVLRALSPGVTWRALVAASHRAFPAQRATGRGTPASLLAKAADRTVAESLRRVGAGTAIRLRHVARTRSADRPSDRRDAGSAGSLQFAAGGRDERERYFEAVERG